MTDAGLSLLDETHDPSCVSWVEGANAPETDFPLANLPFGIFRHDFEERPRVGIAIGDRVLDCLAATRAGLFGEVDPAVRDALTSWTLNPLMALGRGDARAVRRVAHRLLRADTPEGGRARALAGDILASVDQIGMRVPAEIGDYTFFPALPTGNPWMPVGCHGRASGIIPSGTPVRRPRGQVAVAAGEPPAMVPSAALDVEMDLGLFVARGNRLGEPVVLADAEEFLFGLCLVADWVALDLQAWESPPLGPFLSRSFATTVSPWVVTLDALAPFRQPAVARSPGDPALLPHFDESGDRVRGGLGVTVEARWRSAAMRAEAGPEECRARVDAGAMPWTMAQLVTHHTSGGCSLRPGDLLARAAAAHAERPVLQDGDEVALRGACVRAGFRRIGFGECRGEVRPALA